MLQNLWSYLNNNYNESEILYFTIFILLISEIPTVLFTLFDLVKFNFLTSYRITFPNRLERRFPNISEIINALSLSFFIVFIFLIPISYIGISILKYIKWNPYNMSIKLPTYINGFYHYFMISILSEILFYWLHRLVHTKQLYWIHKHHHSYKFNSFSIVNHCLHPIEILLFIIPPIIPPIILGSHLIIVWLYMIITNSLGSYIHSGYQFPFLEKIIMVKSKDHDIHHIKPKYNFGTGLFNSFVDRIFNTYLEI